MESLNNARNFFTDTSLDDKEYIIGHLSDEIAEIIARDMHLIGCIEESEILSDNDTTRYTAIVNRNSGQASEVFFDLT